MDPQDVILPRVAYTSRIVLAAGAFVLVVFALTGMHVRQDWLETRARGEARVMAFATVTEAYVRRRIRETEAGLRAAGESLASEDSGNPVARAIADNHRREFPFIAFIAVWHQGALKVLSGDLAGASLEAASQGSRRSGNARSSIGEPIALPGRDVPLVPLFMTHVGANGDSVDLMAAIRSDVLGLMHRALHSPEGQVSAVFNERGVLLAREPFVRGAIGSDISPSQYYKLSVAGGPIAVDITSPVDGVRYLAATRWLGETGLVIAGAEPTDSIARPWQERALRSLGIAVLLSVFALILAWLAAHRSRLEWRALTAFAQRDSEARVTLANLSEGVVSHSRDGRVTPFNPAALKILGLTESQLLGRSVGDPEWQARREDGRDWPTSELPVVQAMATGEPQRDALIELSDGSGKRRWIAVNATPTFAEGKLTGAVASFVNVTQQQEARHRVEELNRTLEQRVAERTEQLSRLTADLTAAEDRERREIARDLHDDIAQTLAVARIRLAPLLGRQDPHSRAIAKAVADLIERADVSTRSLAAQLAPPALDTLGLVPAIEWLAEEFGKLYGLSVTVENAANRPALGADERMIAYRAVRELLINVTKHAGVDRARVTMQWEAGELVIEVIDEGEGFASAEVGNGLGLRGTREALARVGGRLELESGPAGTCARLFLPCAQGDPLSEGGAA